MYEMRAEHDPHPTDSLALVWHVITTNDTRVALCGRPLANAVHAGLVEGGHASAERYCSPCLTVVRATMEGGAGQVA